MTNWAQNELEERIVRALDGELNAAQRAGLDRELLRDPEARRLMDEYRRIDRRAALALGAALAGRTQPLRVAGIRPRAGRSATWRCLSIALTAAAMGLLAVGVWMIVHEGLWPPGEPAGPSAGRSPACATDTPPAVARVRGAKATTPAKRALHEANGAGVPLLYDTADPTPFFGAPRQGNRIIDRRFIGVFDEATRELFVIEVDRVQTRIDTVSLDL